MSRFHRDRARSQLHELLAIFICCLVLLSSFANPLLASADPQPGESRPEVPQSQNGSAIVFLPYLSGNVHQSGDAAQGWPMAGANPGRTSWTAEEVPGDLKPVWFHSFDAYISQKVQIIAADSSLFISTAKGLYALDPTNGTQRWFFPTDLPLGHSPSVANGVVYVPGFDRQIHALDAASGQQLWSFSASAGFETNPLLAGDKLFAGNRDGFFYAIFTSGPNTGQLAWKFQTGGAILFSAAYADGTLFFASNDNYAYALRAADGALVWKSDKLPGHGFHSYWPVVYQNLVIFPGSYNYRYPEPFPGPHTTLEREGVYPTNASKGDPVGPLGQVPGDWMPGTQTVDASAIAQYFERYPQRRTYFVLDRTTGQELTYDSDGDGLPEYAPMLWFGTHSGTRYPPVTGPDNVLYQANNLYYDPNIPRGKLTGWKIGTPILSIPNSPGSAVDEPLAYSVGGNVVYWKRCCDRVVGSFEIWKNSGTAGDLQKWTYFDDGRPIRRTFPDLFDQGWPFAYWKHGDQSPPVPYQGKVFVILNNAVVAFAPQGLDPVVGSPPPGQYTGSKLSEVQRGLIVNGVNSKVTQGYNSWPLLLQQESYYSIEPSTSAGARWMRLFEVAGSSGVPTSVSAQNLGVYTQLLSYFSSGQMMATFVSRRSPATLFQTTGNQFILKGALSGLAYPTANGVQVSTTAANIAGSQLSAGWLLAWDRTGSHRWAPVVISLEHRPTQISFTSAGITLTYSGSAGYLALTPLYGMAAPISNEQDTWLNTIPQPTIDRISLLDRIARAFPVSLSEPLSIDAGTGNVSISISYQFHEWPGDWSTNPLKVAMLNPVLALAAWNGSPIRINGQPLENYLDLEYVTPLGRLAGVPDSATAVATLPGLANVWRNETVLPGSYNPNDPLNLQLVQQVQKILAAGHLRPAYGIVGIWEGFANHRIGDDLVDYWKNPADTVVTLLRALPFLPSDLQQQVRAYIQNEFSAYPLYKTTHVGWKNGSDRYAFDLPPEALANAAGYGPRSSTVFNHWGLPQQNLYALWMYADEFGNANSLYTASAGKLDEFPEFEGSFPYVLNSYIAGYIGYARLANMSGAGWPADVERTLVYLLIRRAALSKYPNALAQTGFEYGGYSWTLRRLAIDQNDTLFNATVSGSLWSQMPLYGFPIDPVYARSGAASGGDYAFAIDYVNLTPETAAFLRAYAQDESIQILDSYIERAPYWFVAEAEEAGGEGVFQPLYDRYAYFQAKALIQLQNRSELEKYLDVPAVKTGDLFFIQNLIVTLSAGS